MRWQAVVMLAVALGGVSSVAHAAGDAAAGERVFARCKQCHTLESGKNRVGPSLAGVVGRPAGSVPGFNYSPDYPAAGAKGLSWTEETIAKYLANPRQFIADFLGKPDAKSRMAFSVSNAKDRDDVAAYLKRAPSQ